jgi:hypothetical protein
MVKLKVGDILKSETVIYEITGLGGSVVNLHPLWASTEEGKYMNYPTNRNKVRSWIYYKRFEHIPKEKARAIKVLYG